LTDDQGLTYGEGQFYDLKRAELDQNGELLLALWTFWMFSRDTELIRKHWDKIERVAEFPLRPEFWDEEAQMVRSQRDVRERDLERHGIQEGYELTHQVFVSLRLQKAAEMADFRGEKTRAARWRDFAGRIWNSALHNPHFRLVENGCLMKRRLPDGSFQRFARSIPYVHRIDAQTTKVYPRNRDRRGELEPDYSNVYPIVFGLIDPQSDLAQRTLKRVEALWNQEWDFGGYPLHNVDSEPTKLGAWALPLFAISQAALEARQYDLVRRNLDWFLATPDGRGYTWWEYRDVNPDYQIDHGIIPWFTYGEPLVLFVRHLLGFRPSQTYLSISPHLLPEIDCVQTEIRLRAHRLSVTIQREQGETLEKAEVNGEPVELTDLFSVTIPIPETDSEIQIWLGETPG
jgi:hypothetical protein